MAIPIEMPKMSDTMEEGVLVAWLVEEGAKVAAGDIIAQVETDKATMDLEAYDDGVLLKKVIGEGEAVPIGALIAVLGSPGEDVSSVIAGFGAKGGDGAQVEAAPVAPEPNAPAPSAADADRVKSSPLARKMALEHGLDLSTVAGTGPEGRVIKRDIEALLTTAPPAAAAQSPRRS